MKKNDVTIEIQPGISTMTERDAQPEKGQPLPGNIERTKEDSASPLTMRMSRSSLNIRGLCIVEGCRLSQLFEVRALPQVRDGTRW